MKPTRDLLLTEPFQLAVCLTAVPRLWQHEIGRYLDPTTGIPNLPHRVNLTNPAFKYQ